MQNAALKCGAHVPLNFFKNMLEFSDIDQTYTCVAHGKKVKVDLYEKATFLKSFLAT